MNYEAEVKKNYPNSKCIGVGATIKNRDTGLMYYMVIGVSLGENYNKTREMAWKNAYKKIQTTTP